MFHRLSARCVSGLFSAFFAAVTLPASASPRDSVTFDAVDSAGDYLAAANSIRSWQTGGTYHVGQIEIRGTLRKVDPLTSALEAAIEVTTPGGDTLLFHPCPGGDFATIVSGTVTHSLCSAPVASGHWTF
jgi:hypothetical protein